MSDKKGLDIYSECLRLADHSGWITKVAIQYDGPSDAITVYMEFFSVIEFRWLTDLVEAIEIGATDERVCEVWPDGMSRWENEGLYSGSSRFDQRDMHDHGWTENARVLAERLDNSGACSYRESMLDPSIVESSVEWVLANPDTLLAVQIMSQALVDDRAALAKAQEAADNARSRIQIAEAWLSTRLSNTSEQA